MADYWYFIGHERTGRCCDVVAASPEAACRSRGWSKDDCVVIRIGTLDASRRARAKRLTRRNNAVHQPSAQR